MNRKLRYFKNILLIINLISYIYLISKTSLIGIKPLIYLLSLGILIYISYKDYKNKVDLSIRYNLLFCLIEIIILFIIGRALFDPNINYASNHYLELAKYNISKHEYDLVKLYFFLQNFYYIMIMYISIYVYHQIECHGIKYKPSKFSKTSIICLLINILLINPTLECFTSSCSINKLIIFSLIVIGVLIAEIYSLIKNNGKKYEWIIYVSFLLNLFAIISIAINIIMYK